MKRILPLALCVPLLAAPILAGEVNVPGKTEPLPPCSENCGSTTATTSPGTTELEYQLWLLAIGLMVP